MDQTKLIKLIENSFDSIERSEISLRQFVLTDKYGMSREITDNEWREAGSDRVDQEWKDIPDSEIEECECQFAHMQAPEFTYFLPAYMRYSVRNHKRPIWETDIIGSTVFSLYPSQKDMNSFWYNKEQLSLISEAQKNTIIRFLEFVEMNAEDLQRPDARIALDRYWLNEEALNKKFKMDGLQPPFN